MSRHLFLAALLALATLGTASAATDPLGTLAERSGFVRTGRYDEVIALCDAFQSAYPKQVRCSEFGRTPEGRPMKLLIVSNSGTFTAAEAQQRKLPVLLVQGGIHAGEIDGKDAGFLLLRELLQQRIDKGALDNQVLLFVPVFNIDGHERFGRWNRPNQRGPEEMGWRTTAQNLNLNRDYVKADAPEMQAMLALVNAWDPLAYIDLHVTDGAKFQPDVSVQVEPAHAGDAALQRAGGALRDAVVSDLRKHGAMAETFYPSFVSEDDPASGFEDSVPPPRFSDGYFLLRNRFAMLVETHSWKDYKTRVRVTHDTLAAVVAQIAAHGTEWLQAAHAADTRAAALGGTVVPLDYKASAKAHTIAFRGYAYTRTPSDVSGALMTHYDESKPQIWNVPLRDDLQPSVTVTAPGAGYIVPVAFATQVAAKLRQHGVDFRELGQAQPQLATETFRASKATFAAQSFEGHQALTVQGAWKSEPRDLRAGALFVPIAQAKARLVMELLEPQAPDSLLAWGEFNNAFEQKEYMEEYVAEDVARAQLAASPALLAEFQQKLADDPTFAKDPAARLEFFARRHSSWDERLDLYPVLRVASAPRD